MQQEARCCRCIQAAGAAVCPCDWNVTGLQFHGSANHCWERHWRPAAAAAPKRLHLCWCVLGWSHYCFHSPRACGLPLGTSDDPRCCRCTHAAAPVPLSARLGVDDAEGSCVESSGLPLPPASLSMFLPPCGRLRRHHHASSSSAAAHKDGTVKGARPNKQVIKRSTAVCEGQSAANAGCSAVACTATR